jgi:serine/threonine protein kinase
MGAKLRAFGGRTRMIKSQILHALVAALVIFVLFSVAMGQDTATQEEVLEKVKEAASALSRTGDVEQFKQKQGPWVWKDTYIFVLDCDKVYAILRVRPDMTGLQISDPRGSSIFPKPKELCEAARRADGIWIQYWWTKAGEKKSSMEIGYLLGARGTPYIVGARIDEAAIEKRRNSRSIFQIQVKPILIALSFPAGLGLIFLVYRLLSSRSFVAGVGSLSSIPLLRRSPPKLGDYEILSEIGRGGMGTVFKGVGRQRQTVAIKLIGGVGLDPRAGARARNRLGLVREARLAASLRHPNIVKVLDVGREKHALYVIMEYLEGVPLSRYIRNHRPGVLEALRIVAELCDALSYAHGRGVVHRDIKPANIFITADKTVKVLDFGLAFQGDELGSRPALAGTPPYMSPEQISGGAVDARSDVWSAGITLFEILKGNCPFVGEDLLSLRSRIIDEGLPELPSELPFGSETKAILERALAKNRETRYQTAADFCVDLRSLILKIQQANLNSPAIASPPGIHDPVFSWKLNDSSERTLPPPNRMVNLGFRSSSAGQRFV